MKRTGVAFSVSSHEAIGCAIETHRRLGPGLLESSYRRCFAKELALNGIPFEVEVPVTIDYKGLVLECAYRIDVFVNRELVVEVKSVEALKWVHEAQVLTYMKHSRAKCGLLINFNVAVLKDGLRSFGL